jgi:hypothetical protein
LVSAQPKSLLFLAVKFSLDEYRAVFAVNVTSPNPLRLGQERHRQGHGAGRLGAPVPGNHHGRAESARRGWWHEQNRPAALEQRRFDSGQARVVRLIAGPSEHGDVEGSSIVADEVVLR